MASSRKDASQVSTLQTSSMLNHDSTVFAPVALASEVEWVPADEWNHFRREMPSMSHLNVYSIN